MIAALGVNGDAYLVVDPRSRTLDQVTGPPEAIEVWSLQRHVLERGQGADAPFVDRLGTWRLRLASSGGLTVESGTGHFIVFAWRRADRRPPVELGSCLLQPGVHCPLDASALVNADALVLLRIERLLIEADGQQHKGVSLPAG